MSGPDIQEVIIKRKGDRYQRNNKGKWGYRPAITTYVPFYDVSFTDTVNYMLESRKPVSINMLELPVFIFGIYNDHVIIYNDTQIRWVHLDDFADEFPDDIIYTLIDGRDGRDGRVTQATRATTEWSENDELRVSRGRNRRGGSRKRRTQMRRTQKRFSRK